MIKITLLKQVMKFNTGYLDERERERQRERERERERMLSWGIVISPQTVKVLGVN